MSKKIETYLEAIRRGAKTIDSEERSSLENDLEILALRATFRGIIAKQVRIKAGATITQVAEDVGGSNGIISHYETGLRLPSTTAKVGISYLSWLASRGYNPIKGVVPSMGTD